MNSDDEDDDNGETQPCCLCPSSPSSISTIITVTESMGVNSSDSKIDDTKTDYDDNDLESNTSSPSSTLGSSSTKISEYAIARSRIAVEAAMEARRRYTMKKQWNPSRIEPIQGSSIEITSIGRGSSAADEIHQRDQRPVWQQGYGDDCDRNDDANNPSTLDLKLSITSIAEHAAAVGRSKQQQWDHNEQEQPLGKIDEPQIDTIDDANDVQSNQEATTICMMDESDNEKPKSILSLL